MLFGHEIGAALLEKLEAGLTLVMVMVMMNVDVC